MDSFGFTMFSTFSRQVPKGFHEVPKWFPIASHFYCICLGLKVAFFSPKQVDQRGGTLPCNRNFYFEEPSKVQLFFCDGPKRKKKLNLGGRDNRINTKMNNYLRNKRGTLNDLNLCYIIADACCFLNQKNGLFEFFC